MTLLLPIIIITLAVCGTLCLVAAIHKGLRARFRTTLFVMITVILPLLIAASIAFIAAVYEFSACFMQSPCPANGVSVIAFIGGIGLAAFTAWKMVQNKEKITNLLQRKPVMLFVIGSVMLLTALRVWFIFYGIENSSML